jgi:hypothetical protein
MALSEADIIEIQRHVFVHVMAGFNVPRYPAFIPDWWPLKDCWPGMPGRAYVYEMIRRTHGRAGIEYAKTLPLMRQH